MASLPHFASINRNSLIGRKTAETVTWPYVMNLVHAGFKQIIIDCRLQRDMRERPFPLHKQLPDGRCVSGSVVMQQIRTIDLEACPCKKRGRPDEDTLRPILAKAYPRMHQIVL